MKIQSLVFCYQRSWVAGGANFPHYHKTFTETFTAIEGPLGFKISWWRNKDFMS